MSLRLAMETTLRTAEPHGLARSWMAGLSCRRQRGRDHGAAATALSTRFRIVHENL